MLTALAGIAVSFCVTSIPPTGTLLGENQILDMVDHPKKWDGSTVTIRIFPYDNGFGQSFVVCFEPCDAADAARSPFLIYTKAGRFAGLKGGRPVVVTARYSSECFYTAAICPDLRFGLFTEVE